ncbi:MAG: 3-oxoacyl-ACP reductase family protein [Steroidobacteraceae bacterium]
MLLKSRIAIVTGSSAGIGRGVAIAFAAEGARVIVNYPDAGERQAAHDAVDQIRAGGGEAQAVEADVSNEAAAARLVEAAREHFGGVDILVNNAGIANAAPVQEMAIEQWDRVIAVHLRGMFLVTRKVLPLLYARGFGRIINTASQLAYKGAAGFAHYTAAKGAIIAFTRSLALEIGNRGVNVNCVAPGATRTRMLADVPEEIMEQIRAAIPLGRIAEVSDIVPSYVFLASEAGRHYQGQCISPNGGDVFL